MAQKKIIIDTNVYIDIFNFGRHEGLKNPFQYVAYLAHPVLHELWMGARGKEEIKYLAAFQEHFVRLNRLIIPTVSTLISVGQICQKLRNDNKIDPARPKHYNDIMIAALSRQIGATVVTENIGDFQMIQLFVNFDFQKP